MENVENTLNKMQLQLEVYQDEILQFHKEMKIEVNELKRDIKRSKIEIKQELEDFIVFLEDQYINKIS